MDDKKVAIDKASEAVVSEVSFFLAANPIFDKILDSVTIAAKSAQAIARLESGLLQPTPAEPPKAVQTTNTGDTLPPDRTDAMKSRGIDLAWLGMVLPMLINPEARGYLASFLSGLIGTENLEALNTGLKLVAGTLAAVFAVKVFQQVSDTINTFLRLSRLIGVLFNIISDADDGVVDEKKKQDQEKEDYDKKKQKNKEARKGRRAERLKRIQQVKKARQTISTLKKALLVGGPIGIAVGIGSGILIDSLIDYATGDEEKAIEAEDKADTGDEEPEVAGSEQSEASKFGDVLIKNLVDSFNFVQIAKDTVAFVSSGWKNLFSGKDNKKVEAASSTVSAPSSKPPVASTESKPTITASPAAPSPTPAPPPAMSEPTRPTSDGPSLQQTSETVAAEKKDQANVSGGVVINNVSNQTVVVAREETKPEPKVIVSSSSIGR
jgi:hypothetical protein